jgi:hypothetical protein
MEHWKALQADPIFEEVRSTGMGLRMCFNAGFEIEANQTVSGLDDDVVLVGHHLVADEVAVGLVVVSSDRGA